jgi:hypothetical protein
MLIIPMQKPAHVFAFVHGLLWGQNEVMFLKLHHFLSKEQLFGSWTHF